VTTHVTPAIVLSTIRYGDTSKIARLATRDFGVQSAIAKGAMRPRSRFGAALHLLSEGQAHLILSRRSDLHTLAAFDLAQVRVELAGRMDRFSVASLLAEIMVRFAPPAPHPASFDLLRDALAALEITPAVAVDPLGLRMVWQLISVLGFEPALDACARDGVPVPPDVAAAFSTTDGGVLCAACAAGQRGALLVPADRDDLRALVSPGATVPALDDRHLAAHRRLLARWLRHHLGEEATLPALDFWEQRPWIAG